ncbi:enoyl-CoA hydratase/isomerase family protein [Sutcliffiella rhizosphaerae]|uniref:Crotonyl-CoA hydratase n=1 Tax=Sutcliffiella rhizosphaerae TaxID=2880967 RepID=A0ABN8A8Z3_9BACI|nr:enoyl-CoA hydratase/isomerase family protein [Sutcliffiella rhizosphaerae]CAG9619822.1 Crotonyl-CoA hydratase [Sutcliffiella rhizosphaerae]
MVVSKVDKYLDEHNIFWFKINRPEKRNAIDYDVMSELCEAISFVSRNEKIRAFFITGEGTKSFCSGGDLSIFHALHTKEEAYEMLSRMGETLYSLCTLPVPTYAIINGTAIGGGCEIAAACDVRIAYSDSKMGFVQGNLGITTGWGGASMLMEKVTHPHAVMMLNSTKVYTAKEAKELGFVQRVISEEQLPLLHEEVKASSKVLRSYKQAIIMKWKQSQLKQRMLAEIEQCSILWEMEEHHQAVRSFLEGKK